MLLGATACNLVPAPPPARSIDDEARRLALRALPPCLEAREIERGDLAYTVGRATRVETRVIDLRTRLIQKVAAAPLALAGWSPSGQRLLLDRCYSPFSDDSEQMPTLAFWAPPAALPGAHDWLALPSTDGALHVLPFPSGRRRRVLPRGSLGESGQGNVIWSADGKLAWSLSLGQLESEYSDTQTLYVRTSFQDPEVTALTLSEDIGALYFRILDWVPDTPVILAGRGALGVESWVQGVPLVAIDTVTGEIRDLGVSMLLTPEAYAWHPSGSGYVAIAAGESPFLFESGRLVLLDVRGGEMTYLTALDTVAFEPAWSPDGSLLAYAALEVTQVEDGMDARAAERALQGRAIHVLDIESGESIALTDPGDAIDGWPQWLPDGNRLLYTRQHHDQTEVRMIRFEDGREESVVAGLPDPTCYYAGCSWRQILAYAPLPRGERKPERDLEMARGRLRFRHPPGLKAPG